MQQNPIKSHAFFKKPAQIQSGRVLFGRVWSNQVTRYYAFGIAILQKEKAPECDTVKVLGVPLLKTRYFGYEKKLFLFGIPIVTRPNIHFLEEQIASQIDRLLSIPASFASKSAHEDDAALRAGKERLFSMPSYQVMCDARDHVITLESELRIVTAQVEQSMAHEGQPNA